MATSLDRDSKILCLVISRTCKKKKSFLSKVLFFLIRTRKSLNMHKEKRVILLKYKELVTLGRTVDPMEAQKNQLNERNDTSSLLSYDSQILFSFIFRFFQSHSPLYILQRKRGEKNAKIITTLKS